MVIGIGVTHLGATPGASDDRSAMDAGFTRVDGGDTIGIQVRVFTIDRCIGSQIIRRDQTV